MLTIKKANTIIRNHNDRMKRLWESLLTKYGVDESCLDECLEKEDWDVIETIASSFVKKICANITMDKEGVTEALIALGHDDEEDIKDFTDMEDLEMVAQFKEWLRRFWGVNNGFDL